MEPREELAIYHASDLVGPGEIADRCGILGSTVANWKLRTTGFPAPVTQLRMGPVFSWEAVESWLYRTGRAHYLEREGCNVVR